MLEAMETETMEMPVSFGPQAEGVTVHAKKIDELVLSAPLVVTKPEVPPSGSGPGTSSGNSAFATQPHCFVDSRLLTSWLPKKCAQELLDTLVARAGTSLSARKAAKGTYPVATDTFGLGRQKDGALPLDRWGSKFESWARVQQAPRELESLCSQIRSTFSLGDNMINSVAVNYYVSMRSLSAPSIFKV